jgi:hypothetical protein
MILKKEYLYNKINNSNKNNINTIIKKYEFAVFILFLKKFFN